MTIRPATETDQAAIRRLVRAENLNPMSLRWPNFLIAEEDGAIVGIGQVKTHGDHTLELASMVVVPQRRGQGVGAALIDKLIARHPGQVLHLTCRAPLRGYYERFGFRVVSPEDYSSYFRRLLPLLNFVARVFGQRILVMRRVP